MAGYSQGEPPKALAANDFTVGENVEVWSNGRGKWLPAVVHGVYIQATTTEGFDVKVLSEAGVKWVLAESVATVLRKVTEVSDPGAEAKGAASPTAKLCLKPYDTCCKRCAKFPGSNEHDENCGGRQPDKSPSIPSVDLQHSLRNELEAMLSDESVLEETVKGAFSRAGKNLDRISWDELRSPVEALLEGFGVHLGVIGLREKRLQNMSKGGSQDPEGIGRWV
eukprot:Skav219697  [mRNA]  locus=scaffold817:252279:257036:+ [translate_table: standard]